VHAVLFSGAHLRDRSQPLRIAIEHAMVLQGRSIRASGHESVTLIPSFIFKLLLGAALLESTWYADGCIGAPIQR